MITINNATIQNIDCMELLRITPDKFYDLAIVDPPYGINVNHSIGRRPGQKQSNFNPVKWDNFSPSIEYFKNLNRVSKNQIIWGANHFIEKIPNANSPCWIVWDKLFSEEVSFASCELAYSSFKTTIKRISLSSSGQDRIHPTQKPIKLYEWLLANYAKAGDKILDTHLGSGSHAIACNNLGFELMACELDKDYYEESIKRIRQATAQQRLFA